MGQASTNTSLRLRQAILSNGIPLAERLLHANPHLLHNPDHTDKANTSLHLAAQAGHNELAELLISLSHDSCPEVTDLIYSNAGNNLGISVNTDGQIPLHLAASRHQVDVIELLCTRFPNTINRGDKEGRTPLLLAAGAQDRISTATQGLPDRKNTLHNKEDVRAIELLLHDGADVHAQDKFGDTCLHQACSWGNLKTARALVQAGADPLATHHKGFHPDAYSLTVQADVYFRNLVAEFERRKGEEVEMAKRRDVVRRGNGGGQVRLVETYEDDDESDFDDADGSGRSRSGSGRSHSTNEDSGNGLGITTSDTGLMSSQAWS